MLVLNFRLLFVTTKALAINYATAQKSLFSICNFVLFYKTQMSAGTSHNAPLRVLLGQMEGIYVILTFSQWCVAGAKLEDRNIAHV